MIGNVRELLADGDATAARTTRKLARVLRSHFRRGRTVVLIGHALGVGMPSFEYFVIVPVINILSAIPIAGRIGGEFMPSLAEGDMLYMPTTFAGISIEEAKRQLGHQDRILADFPEVRRVFGKAGRAETATDPAPGTVWVALFWRDR